MQQAVSPGEHGQVTVVAAAHIPRHWYAPANDGVQHCHLSPHDACETYIPLSAQNMLGARLSMQQVHIEPEQHWKPMALFNLRWHCGNWQPVRASAQRRTVTQRLTFVGHGQPAQAVVSVDVHAGIVQHNVWSELVQIARQPLCQAPAAGKIAYCWVDLCLARDGARTVRHRHHRLRPTMIEAIWYVFSWCRSSLTPDEVLVAHAVGQRHVDGAPLLARREV